MAFVLDGKELTPDYDEDADILFLWVDGPRPAITHETDDGHHVQLDPVTREVVGLAIIDYRERWEGRPIKVELPSQILELA